MDHFVFLPESNHEVKSNLYFLCPECDFGTEFKRTFANHLSVFHGLNWVSQSYDGLKTLMVEGLTLTPHVDPGIKPNPDGTYECPHCLKIIPSTTDEMTYGTPGSQNSLQHHSQETHGPHAWYACPFCPYENRFVSGVCNHFGKTHGDLEMPELELRDKCKGGSCLPSPQKH